MKKILLILIPIILSVASKAQWQMTGGPSAGHISALTIKDTILIAGTETGGVFVSTDYGSTWTQSNTGLTNLNEVKALIANNTYVFAGIGNSLGGPAVFSSVNN